MYGLFLLFCLSGPFLFVPKKIHIKDFGMAQIGFRQVPIDAGIIVSVTIVKYEKTNCFMLSSCCPMVSQMQLTPC